MKLNSEYISNWPPWCIRHCTLAIRLTCPNCYNIMNAHGHCDLPLLFNSVFHDTILNLARVHFKSQHQKSRIYCLLVSIILHHSLYNHLLTYLLSLSVKHAGQPRVFKRFYENNNHFRANLFYN